MTFAIGTWIVLSGTVGLFMAMIITCSMKSKIVRCIVTILIALIFGALITGMMVFETSHDEKVWSDGYCECGGDWHLVNVIHYRNGGNKFWYECSNCFSSICTNRKMR